MDTLANILKVLAPLGYLITHALYFRLFTTENENKHAGPARFAFLISLALHTALLFSLAYAQKRCPLFSQGEALLFMAWILAGIHLVSEFAARTPRMGFFTLAPVTVLLCMGPFLVMRPFELPEKFHNPIFIFHIVASLASYASFSLAAILAGLYLLLRSKLKRKKFDLTFRKLPPLDQLDKLSAMWSFLGTATMAIASIIGVAFVRGLGSSGMSLREAGLYLSLAVFLFAAIMRRLRGWRGSLHAKIILIGFALLILLNLLGTHGFNA